MSVWATRYWRGHLQYTRNGGVGHSYCKSGDVDGRSTQYYPYSAQKASGACAFCRNFAA